MTRYERFVEAVARKEEAMQRIGYAVLSDVNGDGEVERLRDVIMTAEVEISRFEEMPSWRQELCIHRAYALGYEPMKLQIARRMKSASTEELVRA